MLPTHVMDLDWMFEICQKEYPVDIESAVKAIDGKQFWMVSTDILTGELSSSSQQFSISPASIIQNVLVFMQQVIFHGRIVPHTT